jgi:hypothetical protein
MARKPNYDFERRERDKAKAAKAEERAKLKAERKNTPEGEAAPEAEAGSAEAGSAEAAPEGPDASANKI